MLEFLGSDTLYKILRGPMCWVAFGIFIIGSIYRIVKWYKELSDEKVVFAYFKPWYALKSYLHWLTPYGSRNWRLHPYMSLFTFFFHVGIVIIPIFLSAHNLLIYESWGISWWTVPDAIADAITLIALIACVFFLGRRLILKEVRYVTSASDYYILGVVFFTLLTAFLAYHQIGYYKAFLNLHIFFGELMLVSIPFTRLAHMWSFFFTRGYTASEFGYVRRVKDW
ncbi:MAG: respiratory nitrate reductase subunit gamma [Thermodesulfobacteria bacterium]|nr:respiratory nitrate reductase subunit gamma [Thermodesulfobacteriota bacterium]